MSPDRLKLSRSVSTFGISIDPQGTVDVDDLVWIHPLGRSSWELIISIPRLLPALQATPQGTQILEQGIQQGFTRYRPEGRIPMLPPEIEERGSLLPGQVRDSYSLYLPLTLKGATCWMGSAQVRRTQVTPLVKLTYEQTDRLIETSSSSNPLAQTLSLLFTVAVRLQQQRRSQGAIGGLFDLPSGQISGEEGQPLSSPGQHRSHLIVSELMIWANHALASLAQQHQIPTLFRNHTATAGRLDRMEKAHYSPINRGHLGLGVSAYGHFTSPLRRAVDLINQLCTLEKLLGGQAWFTPDQLVEQGEYLTQLPWEEQEQREEYYRQRTLHLGISSLQTGAAVDSAQLQMLVKAAYGVTRSPAGLLSPELDQQLQIVLLNAIQSGRIEQIPLETLALLLMKPLRGSGWPLIREQIAAQVFERSHLAAQIWNHWSQSSQQDFPQVLAAPLGAAHAPRWQVTASFQSHQVQIDRPQKKQAEQQALALLLTKVGGIQLSVDESAPLPEPPQQAPYPPTNWKGQVLETVAAQGWPTPQVDLHRVGGPDHNPQFQATITLQIPTSEPDESDSIVIRSALGESKKIAEQLGFQQIWDLLTSLA